MQKSRLTSGFFVSMLVSNNLFLQKKSLVKYKGKLLRSYSHYGIILIVISFKNKNNVFFVYAKEKIIIFTRIN